MALTPEVIKANPDLATLTEAQLTTIATLSANDEATVINTKIGEHHGLIEKDVAEVSGVKKNDGEKSYDYVKRVLTDFKAKATPAAELQTKIATQEAKIVDLEKKITEGKGNEALAQKLTDAESQLNALKTQLAADKTTFETEKGQWAKERTDIKLAADFGKAAGAITFKPGYTESIQKTLLDSAQKSIISQYKPDWVEANGEKILVFRDANNEIVRNKANGLNPYTALELVTEQLKDAIDPGQKKPGAGTEPPGKTVVTVDIVDIVAAKTQIEADELIIKHLLQKGLVRTDPKFSEEQKKLREENKVSVLPIR